jgi:Tfp pilus assembly protein PilV
MNIKRTNKLKTNTSGFGHIEMLLLVVAVVVIGGVGFFVYQNQNKKTASKATAHAGTPTKLGESQGIMTSACKTYSSVYGGIYSVKVFITKNVNTTAYAYDISDRNGTTSAISQHTFSAAYYAGTVASYTINMSVVNKDYITIIAPNTITSSTIQIIPGSAWSGYARGINNIVAC